MEHMGSLESTQEARVALGYRLGQLLRHARTIQHSTLYDRHCIALLGKVFKRTIHGLYNHSTSMTKQRIVVCV